MINHESITKDNVYQSDECAEFELTDRILVVHMKEDLDHHNAIYIREYTDKKLLNSNVKNLIFDFTKVKFMDSSGIGVIVGRYKRMKLMGNGRVAVTGVSQSINRILIMSGLYSVVDKYQNLTDAIQAMIAK